MKSSHSSRWEGQSCVWRLLTLALGRDGDMLIGAPQQRSTSRVQGCCMRQHDRRAGVQDPGAVEILRRIPDCRIPSA